MQAWVLKCLPIVQVLQHDQQVGGGDFRSNLYTYQFLHQSVNDAVAHLAVGMPQWGTLEFGKDASHISTVYVCLSKEKVRMNESSDNVDVRINGVRINGLVLCYKVAVTWFK